MSQLRIAVIVGSLSKQSINRQLAQGRLVFQQETLLVAS